jgi:hypothetical protein
MGEFPANQPKPAENAGPPSSLTDASAPAVPPTPDYVTLGPTSDLTAFGPDANQSTGKRRPSHIGTVLAIAIGIAAALGGRNIGSLRSARRDIANISSSLNAAPSARDIHQLDRLKPQKQAEALLEQAVGHSSGAVEQISSRVEGWQGKVQWTSQIATLATAALNSDDMHVRESGVEVELAAYGIGRNHASLGYVLKMAESSDHAQKIWALWVLGLLGNRGVETAQVVEVLTAHLKDADAESRQWAAEGLALTGADQGIQPLLQAMHDDPSPLVRERAACGISESGLFTEQQRFSAVSQLLSDSDDPTLDAQTHGWAFQALGDITHQRLPNDSAVWRRWYEGRGE